MGNWNEHNGLNVNDWNADHGNDNLRAVRLVVSGINFGIDLIAWWSGSTLQASCLFPAALIVALSIFFLLKIESLYLTLKELSADLIYGWSFPK